MSEAGRDAVERLAEEFLARRRRGERPTISEYAKAHPALAAQIGELFPAIVFIETMGGNGVKAAEPVPVPRELGDFRLLREVGRGGMGVVYEAVQTSLGRHVALKVLPPAGLMNPAALERFQREARAAAGLHHPNIVPVFGVGEAGGVHYYVMQFIHGRGLDAVLGEVRRLRGQAKTRADADRTAAAALAAEVEPGPAEQHMPKPGVGSRSDGSYYRGVARLGVQVAQALAYAHAQGVLHRDVKPSNLILDTRGTVWVADFGLAKTESDGGLTGTGDLVGTLRYMAPERFRGVSEPRGDVYSLGVTLYEMITLRPAFDESDRARLIDRVARDDPPPPRQLDSRVPRDLETIVLKAMAKEPNGRYATAELLADDLDRFLQDRPIRARRASAVERVGRWCRRNPWLAGITGVAGMLSAVILVGGPLLLVKLWNERRATQHELWGAHLARAEAQRLTNRAGRRFDGLASLDGARSLLPRLPGDSRRPFDLRTQTIACLSLADLGAGRGWDGYPAGSAGVGFAPDLDRYARGDDSGAITVRRVADDSEIVPLPGTGHGAWTLRFSRDGRYLAAGYQQRFRDDPLQFRVWDCQTGESVLQVPTTAGCGEADFSPDGRRVAISRGGYRVSVHELPGGAEVAAVKVNGLAKHLSIDPAGGRLAVALDRVVEVLELPSGNVLDKWTHPAEVGTLAWRPDGKLLAAASGSVIHLWEPSIPQARATLRAHEQAVSELAFSRSGELLASKGYDSTVRLWDVDARRVLVRAPCVYTGCAPLHFGPGDRQLGFGSDGTRLWLWDVAAGRECRPLIVPPPATWYSPGPGRFSPCGRFLAAGGTDGVRVWDWASRRQVAHLAIQRPWAALWTADGRSLLTTSAEGLTRRPASYTDGDIEFGPPQRLGPTRQLESADMTPDGMRLLARVRTGEAVFLDLQGDATPKTIGDHPQLQYVAVSPDGGMLATGTWYGAGVKVWDAAGKLLRELPAAASATVTFSPDGGRLVVGVESRYEFWDTRSWQRALTIAKTPENTPGQSSYSTDGKTIALRLGPTRIGLVNPGGETLAELETPGQQTMVWHALSPDGRALAAFCVGGATHVWDLGAIRRQLAERSLDW